VEHLATSIRLVLAHDLLAPAAPLRRAAHPTNRQLPPGRPLYPQPRLRSWTRPPVLRSPTAERLLAPQPVRQYGADHARRPDVFDFVFFAVGAVSDQGAEAEHRVLLPGARAREREREEREEGLPLVPA
jgi:hypothetical protein